MSARETWHGTYGGYTNHACRCIECSAAAKAEMKRHKVDRLAARQLVDGQWIHPDAPHGRYSSYTNYGCRCDECRAAGSRRRAQLATTSRKAVA